MISSSQNNEIRLYLGRKGKDRFLGKPKSLYNGLIFEGSEIAVAEDYHQSVKLNKTFALAMWVYIADINGVHTLFCEQKGPSNRASLCLKFDQYAFFWVLGDSGPDQVVQMAGMIPQCKKRKTLL